MWGSNSLMEIGNALGKLYHACPNTSNVLRTTYVRICVQMDLSKGLKAEIIFTQQDYRWVQKLDYENVYF